MNVIIGCFPLLKLQYDADFSCPHIRVATAQGKQGIGMLTFQTGKTQGIQLILIFTQEKLWQHRENCVLVVVVESLTCSVIVTCYLCTVTYVLKNTGKLVMNSGKTQGI